jgi:hypothetical protein
MQCRTKLEAQRTYITPKLYNDTAFMKIGQPIKKLSHFADKSLHLVELVTFSIFGFSYFA